MDILQGSVGLPFHRRVLRSLNWNSDFSLEGQGRVKKADIIYDVGCLNMYVYPFGQIYVA